jgi:hypothetical protein
MPSSNVSAQEFRMNDEREDYYSYGDDEREYSSYDNYGYSDKSYGDDSYGDDSYGDDSYGDKSYGKKYPPMKDKKFVCPSGIVVDKQSNCPLVCPPGSDFAGHLVAAGSNLNLVCNDGDGVDAEICPDNTDLPGVLVENAPEDCEIFDVCPATSDLPGVLVQDAATDCDIDGGDGVSELQVQCLKCADLATVDAPQGGFNRAQETANDLIGTETNNVFDVCEETTIEDATAAFNALVTGAQEDEPEEAFEDCLINAGFPEGNGLQAAQPASQESALQETSPTTNVEPQPEIPTTTESSAQQTGDLTAQQKSDQLMAQWIENIIR